ncbi:hypothetical protein B0H11DRAFT_1724766 [Mycena galericulata]|nr:hypothetical protein B0H11DRAFT_1724766 [Mycena galericulata]
MVGAEIVPMFSGDPDVEEVTPSTFIKKFRSHTRDLGGTAATDPERISAFLDYLVEDSAAEKWYKDLQASANPATTWAAMEAAFALRFPGPQKAERTTQEWERELAGMKLTMEELDTTVKVGGADVFAHVHFASRLLETAKLAKIQATTSGIWQARDALPDVLREKISPTQADWTAFTNAIKAVDRVHIREGVVKAKKARDMERMVRDLAKDRGRAPPPAAPTTPVSKMSAQLAQAALNTPRQPVANAPPQNPFGAGGGRGNLFSPPQRGELTPESIAKLKENAAKLGRTLLRDDAAGRAEYARRVALWDTAYAGVRPALELTGYPLSPGTVAPGSGECYKCGRIASPWHRSDACPGPELPQKEVIFRRLCGKYLPRLPPPTPVNAVLTDWMDFVGDEEEEQDFQAGSSE